MLSRHPFGAQASLPGKGCRPRGLEFRRGGRPSIFNMPCELLHHYCSSKPSLTVCMNDDPHALSIRPRLVLLPLTGWRILEILHTVYDGNHVCFRRISYLAFSEKISVFVVVPVNEIEKQKGNSFAIPFSAA